MRRLPHPAGILFLDLLLQGSLDGLTAAELAEVCSWLAFESDRRLNNRHVLNGRLARVREQLWQIEEYVHSIEDQVGLRRSPKTRQEFHGVALCWTQGKSLQKLLERIDLAEGDVLMLLNQTIDLLQQVQSAVGHVLDARGSLATGQGTTNERGLEAQRTARQKRNVHKQHFELSSLEAIRPRLAKAINLLLHGIVLQSRSIPATPTHPNKEELPLDAEEDSDPAVMQAEEQAEPEPECPDITIGGGL